MTLALSILVAYLLGGVPFGLILGRWFGGIDVRGVGSGNIGATNVARSLGAWAGVLTLLLDIVKGAAAVALGQALAGTLTGAALAGLAAVVGHIWPVYLRFHGGKGVATGFGVFLMLATQATLGAAIVFAILVALSRRVSVGSMGSAAALPVILAISQAPRVLLVTALISSSLIVVRHRENMRKLWRGLEPKLGEKK